jgi:hypothetical protein
VVLKDRAATFQGKRRVTQIATRRPSPKVGVISGRERSGTHCRSAKSTFLPTFSTYEESTRKLWGTNSDSRIPLFLSRDMRANQGLLIILSCRAAANTIDAPGGASSLWFLVGFTMVRVMVISYWLIVLLMLASQQPSAVVSFMKRNDLSRNDSGWILGGNL